MKTLPRDIERAGARAPKPYRYDHPRVCDIVNDMYVRRGEPGPGSVIRHFDLPTTDGRRLRSADFAASGQAVLLVFGSLTCPVTESGAEGLVELHARYGSKVRFVMVQVREAHPGATIPQPRTSEQKLRHAASLKAHHHLPFEVAVDDIDGTLHRELGSRPNSAYVIDGSRAILFRAQWGNEMRAIGEALEAIAAGRKPPVPSVTRTVRAIARTLGYIGPVLDAAGKGARLDTWKVAPPMGVLMTLADLFFFLPRSRRGAAAMALALGGVAAVAAGLVA
jgi:hypothetical protein